ncbi:hypothetical protein KY285_008179 [Solanum tuberosum]|nr:hypothetical protein KY285_008179 [Solanum tuberosum]
MLNILNEIDLVAFTSLSINPISTPISTIPPVEECQIPTPEVIPDSVDKGSPVCSPYLDLNDPQNSSLYKGDLPEEKKSESNILAASKELMVESLTEMRESTRAPFFEEGDRTPEAPIETSEPMFDKTQGTILPSTIIDDEEDNRPLHWVVQRRMVPISSKGKEKVTEEKSAKKIPYQGFNKKVHE